MSMAEGHAKHVRSGQDLSVEDFLISMRFWFSRKYNIPMFSPVLEEYDTYQLLLEYYLHSEYDKPTDKQVQDLMKTDKGEVDNDLIDGLFKEFAEELSDEEAMKQMFPDEDRSWEFKE